MPEPLPPEWQPSDGDVAGLGPRARVQLDATLSLYRLTAVEGGILMESLRSLTRIEQLDDAITAAGLLASHKLLSAAARERRIFLSLWQSLQFDRADRS